MQAARYNRRIPIIAGVVLILLVALWHSKPALSDHAVSAFKGIHGYVEMEIQSASKAVP